MEDKYSSGILFRFVIGEFDVDRYDNIFKALKLYALNVIPDKISREVNDINLTITDYSELSNYYNEYMKYTLKGIATNSSIVPNNNLIYDFVTIIKTENAEVNLCFSYTNIFITVVAEKKCVELDVLTRFLHNEFVEVFRRAIVAEVQRNGDHFELDRDIFEEMVKNVYVYKLPTDTYPVNFSTMQTKTFDKNSKSQVAKLFDNREKVTRIFATYGSLV